MIQKMKQYKTQKIGEGVVVIFTDGSIIKVKTKEFFELHKIYNESDSFKIVLRRILDEDMDDILGIVSDQKRARLLTFNKAISDYVVHFVREIEDIISVKRERKELAMKYKTHPWFSVIMAAASGKDIKTVLIERMKGRFSKELQAKEFINGLINENQ